MVWKCSQMKTYLNVSHSLCLCHNPQFSEPFFSLSYCKLIKVDSKNIQISFENRFGFQKPVCFAEFWISPPVFYACRSFLFVRQVIISQYVNEQIVFLNNKSCIVLAHISGSLGLVFSPAIPWHILEVRMTIPKRQCGSSNFVLSY